MEKILVAIDSRRTSWEAVYHACSLAKRIHVQLNVLMVLPTGPQQGFDIEAESGKRRRIELLVESAKAEGVTVNFFIAEGSYEDEVISFINRNNITMLVLQQDDGSGPNTSRELTTLRSLQHRITCKMEIVAPRKEPNNKTKRIS